MQSRSTSSFICPEIVGRESYLEAVQRFLSLAGSKCLLISGEAGIGKTRLVNRGEDFARQSGFHVYRGRCFEQDRYFPYAPLIDLIGNLFSRESPEDALRSSGGLASPLLKLMPQFSSQFPGSAPSTAADPEEERLKIFQAFTQVFVRLSESQPLLVIVEDIHWSDDVSLECLLYLARRVASHPLLLLMTYRGEEVHASLDSFLAALNRDRLSDDLRLPPLTRAETDAMLRAIFGQSRPGYAEFHNALYELAEGNPFFIEEVLKSLAASGDLFHDDEGWDWKPSGELQIPRSVAHTVNRRLEQLTPAARELALIAAAVGRQFDFTLLKTLTGYDESELLVLIRELIQAQLVVDESAERFAFRHAMTRQAVYGGLMARERQAMHLKVAETIERSGGTIDAHLAGLSYHFSEAGAWEKSLDYSYRMGQKADSLYSPYAAVEHYTRAIEASRHTSVPPRSELYRARALACDTLGEFERARVDMETALDIAHQSRDRHGEWQALIDLGALWSGHDYNTAGEYFRRGFDLAGQTNDEACQAHSLNRLGNWHLNIGHASEAMRQHERAVEIFRGMDDPHGLAGTLDLLGMTNYLSGDLVRGTEHYREVLEIFRKLDDRRGLVSCLGTLQLRGGGYHWDAVISTGERLTDCARSGEEALRIARDIGWYPGEAYAMFNLGFCLGPAGEFGQALDFLRGSLDTSEDIQHQQWMAAARCGLGALYLDLLELDTARAHFEIAFELAQITGSAYWIHNASSGLGSTYVQQGEFERAETIIQAESSQSAELDLGQRQSLSAFAELLLARGEAERALRVVERLVSSAPNTGLRRIPRLSRLRGDILMALERYEEAETELQRVLDIAGSQGALPMLWRAHASLGRLYRATRSRREAQDEFALARSVIDGLASTIPDESLRESFARSANATMPPAPTVTPLRAAKKASGGLTTRERDAARLIAKGYSNRQIAEALVITERTVESHVSHILTKLRFTSRAQIASWVVETGLNAADEQAARTPPDSLV